MRRTIVSVLLCLVVALPAHANKSVRAAIAASDMPVPTFTELHEQFVRTVVNESGFRSLADQDGILQSLLYFGGKRDPRRNFRGSGWGLDYSKLMRRILVHSTRTVPPDSKFLVLTSVYRSLLTRQQTRQNRWASTLTLDCAEPSGWPKRRLDGASMPPWEAHYGERCRLVVETTEAFLKGKMETYCDGMPTTWGNEDDVRRKGGALDSGWREIVCDRPNPNNPGEDCDTLSRRQLRNSTSCASNRFWTWLQKDKEDYHAKKTQRQDE